MTTSPMWTFADLDDDELRIYAAQACLCKTATESGTRSGYICPAHRAQRELDRRELRDE